MKNDNQDEPSASGEGIASQALATIDQVAPSGWRLKLAKAGAQLLVGTRAGAAVYADAREHLDEIEGRSALNKQLYAIAAQQVLNDPEMVERAKARLIGGMLSKQENLEAVISGAEQKMLALPAPVQSDTGRLPDEDHEQADETAARDPLSPDWAATFSQVAENASSEEVRDRLSRVLAGEIAVGGTFPKSILRSIAELERSDLEGLVAVMPFAHGKAILRDAPIPIGTLELLNDSGLVDYNPTLQPSMSATSKPDAAGALAGVEWAIVIEVAAEKSVSSPIAPLTRLGRAVISLMDQFDEREALKGFASRMDKTDVKRIILGKYESPADGVVSIPNGEIIYPEPQGFSFVHSKPPANPFSPKFN